MNKVYINFKKEWSLYNKDYEEENVIYNFENNIVAISNVNEIIYGAETIKIYYNKRATTKEYYLEGIEKVTIN